ncbi:MAG: transcriptional regulator [Lachnospiraceae bacterium]|nr:transcriptional regulator [Lachnospiraceae bacterium]
MEIHNIPDLFSNKLRLAVMVSLVSGEKSFQELKKVTNASDGNLGAQLLKLENEKYIESTKSFFNRKPRTTYKITELGTTLLNEYVDLLERVIHGAGKKDNM